MTDYAGKLLIITGERKAGKTTLCRALVRRIRARSIPISGITSPAVFVDGQKTGIDAVDLSSKERRSLAVYDPEPAPPAGGGKPLHYRFDPAVIDWGNAIFRKAVPATVLFVDEIGPLELKRGQGWTAALNALDARQYQIAVMVMRPELLDESLARWPWAEVVSVPNVEAVSILADQLMSRYFEGLG